MILKFMVSLQRYIWKIYFTVKILINNYFFLLRSTLLTSLNVYDFAPQILKKYIYHILT